MTFFSTFKRVLGFSGDDDDIEDPLYADTTLDNESTPAGTAPAATSADPDAAVSAPVPVTFDPAMRDRIFDKVLESFNAALPDFLARSVDPDAQRRYLIDALDADIKVYIDSLNAAADAVCRHEWEARQAALSAELEQVRRRAAEVEAREADARQKQLSADRQRTALSSRVHDLENTLSKLEADREQYELENRSLVNRLKVAGIHEDDAEAARAEVERLQKEIAALRANPDSGVDKAVEEATAPLKARIAEMAAGIDSLKEQQRVSDEMLADSRRRLKESDAALNDSRSRLGETEKMLAEFDSLSGKMDAMDQALAARDSKIKKLQKKVNDRDKELADLRAQLDSMRAAAVADVPADEYVAAASVAPAIAADDSPAPRISDTDLAALEESFQSEDWFTKTPPAETPSMRSPEAEAEFGYHPPRRRTVNHNPDQLSLF